MRPIERQEKQMSDDMNDITASPSDDRADGHELDADSAGAQLSADPDDAVLESGALEEKVLDVLKTVYDPEIPIDIYELGLIYDVRVENGADIVIDMTLTSPACPVAGSLPAEVQYKVGTVPEVNDVSINLVWEPPWTPDLMSEAAKLELNMW